MKLKPERRCESFSNDDLSVALVEVNSYLRELPMGMRVASLQVFYAEKDKTYSIIIFTEQKGL
jgi:hypothetical protein